MSFLSQWNPATNTGIFGSGAGASLLAVPVMWVLSIGPHFYAAYLSKGNFRNTDPRGYLAEIQRKEKKTPTDREYIRAESAQQNGFENIALFASALIAATVAKVPADEVQGLAAGYLISRVLYNVAYIKTTTEKFAALRSITFLSGVGIIWTLFIKAAYRFK